MSNKYNHQDEVPLEVLCVRLDELSTAVTKGNMNEFDMRVPAERDRDADLVLADASRRLKVMSKSLKGIGEVLEDWGKPKS